MWKGNGDGTRFTKTKRHHIQLLETDCTWFDLALLYLNDLLWEIHAYELGTFIISKCRTSVLILGERSYEDLPDVTVLDEDPRVVNRLSQTLLEYLQAETRAEKHLELVDCRLLDMHLHPRDAQSGDLTTRRFPNSSHIIMKAGRALNCDEMPEQSGLPGDTTVSRSQCRVETIHLKHENMCFM